MPEDPYLGTLLACWARVHKLTAQTDPWIPLVLLALQPTAPSSHCHLHKHLCAPPPGHGIVACLGHAAPGSPRGP
ncbi:hypothetical protein Y1Q_0018303 [Alligator mississippiensis]|uniref:Uncharacterized protein n=1 Tax=Alligator mississippiensis TaxID=8496 RepID=A0A151PBZ4_ALLMI|nr:hypothetical protein Y1Q_0018303 [Alligator mississippiensis]